MKDQEVRIAMIGCGRRAPAYRKTIKAVPGCRVTALCDKIVARIKQIKTMFDDESIREYTDYRKMLADDICDAVFVITEPEYQAGLSVAAMEAGKDVFSEVPVAYSIEDCWRVVVAAERTGRVYYLGEQVRHSPLMRYWQQIVRAGALGTILFAEGHYLHAMTAERFWLNPETGELLTWEKARNVPNKVKTRQWTIPHPILYGPHEMSPFLKILDDRVVAVSCYSSGVPSKRLKEVPFPCQDMEFPIADLEVALMHTVKGTIIRFAMSSQLPVSKSHWYHLLGTKGEVETSRGQCEPGYSYFCSDPVLSKHINNKQRIPEPWFHSSGRPPEDIVRALGEDKLSEQARSTGHGGKDYYPVADFIRHLREGTPPDIDVYQAVETAAPCIVAARSAEQGGANLAVPDFRPGPGRQKGGMPSELYP